VTAEQQAQPCHERWLVRVPHLLFVQFERNCRRALFSASQPKSFDPTPVMEKGNGV
jgi:hypothetical protein